MVLSSSQHILLVVSLALCLCFLVPRMIGGGGENAKKDPSRMTPPLRGHPHKESPAKSHMPRVGSEKGFSNMDHIKSAMEKELKSETGGSRSMAFALMPLYAVGVALFAAYKFAKIKSKENSQSKSTEDDKKAKRTESQLLELERHLSQTEQMLNSILTQLDPLSNCVSTLATEQKSEIMNQLQSIRQLMKTTGMDRSANQPCENTLEDLIHSFKTQQSEVQENDVESKSEESPVDLDDADITAHNLVTEESSLNASGELCEEEDDSQFDGADATSSPTSEGLRKRNIQA
ncbi:PREDICTED: coiled-coil domain-containing protein 107 [Nanorana parkeri]|uniref:coiled-coil domain-containing protein 107 n=1 Tax=Nanorana parkeri TaxID=125878 RepID=UPI000854AEA5|nr:PREDICTED: coiled-coil domain-containing protein 107 [Nanorana parkeri]